MLYTKVAFDYWLSKQKDQRFKFVGEFWVKDVEEYIKYHDSMDEFNKFYSLQKHVNGLVGEWKV